MPIKSPLTIEQIRQVTRQLTQQRPTSAAMLAFYENVVIAQEQAKRNIDKDSPEV